MSAEISHIKRIYDFQKLDYEKAGWRVEEKGGGRFVAIWTGEGEPPQPYQYPGE